MSTQYPTAHVPSFTHGRVPQEDAHLKFYLAADSKDAYDGLSRRRVHMQICSTTCIRCQLAPHDAPIPSTPLQPTHCAGASRAVYS